MKQNFKVNSQRAALTKALLDGIEISAMSAFEMLAVTNCSREINRSIISQETGFGANIIKTRVDFVSTYGKKGFYFKYKLERSEANKIPIKRMQAYLSESELKPIEKKKEQYVSQDLFSNL